MRGRIRAHLTYANVASSLALFIALAGGTAWATHEVINSSDVVDNSLQSVDLKDNAGVKSADVLNDTVTGGGLAATDLKPSSVGTSEVADNSLSGGDINESTLQGSCPSGMTAVNSDLCFDSADRSPLFQNWAQALETCRAAGRRLPSVVEANEARVLLSTGQYWTGDIFDDGTAQLAWMYNSTSIFKHDRANVGDNQVRCVTSLRP